MGIPQREVSAPTPSSENNVLQSDILFNPDSAWKLYSWGWRWSMGVEC